MKLPELALIVVLGLSGAGASPLQAEQTAPPESARAPDAETPAFLLRLSAAAVRDGLRDRVDETNDVDENILGRQVRGRGRLTGEYSFQLVPDDRRAVVRVDFSGVNATNTTTEAGPVCLFVRGRTQLRGGTHIYLAPDRFRADAARTDAETDTDLTGVSTRFRRTWADGIARRIATREFFADQAERDRLAAQRSAEDFNERIDEEAQEFIDGLNGPRLDYVRRAFSGEAGSAGRLNFRTTAEALEIFVTPRSGETAYAPPASPADADLEFHIHESLLNNLGDRLAGRTVAWDEIEGFRDAVTGRASAPPETPADDSPPAGVTLADDEPLRCTMRDGAIDVVIRGERFSFGGRDYPSMDIHLRYELKTGGSAPRLARAGVPRVVPGARGEQNLAEQVQDAVQQQFLQALVLRVLNEDLAPATITARGELEDLGSFSLAAADIADGWLSLAYRRPTTLEKPTEPGIRRGAAAGPGPAW
jgi:hypothetical protein